MSAAVPTISSDNHVRRHWAFVQTLRLCQMFLKLSLSVLSLPGLHLRKQSMFRTCKQKRGFSAELFGVVYLENIYLLQVCDTKHNSAPHPHFLPCFIKGKMFSALVWACNPALTVVTWLIFPCEVLTMWFCSSL